jgi:predicted nuclease of restriction endonuclease-like (RecB) superfamily
MSNQPDSWKPSGEQFDFESLVRLCRQTHESMQIHAARAINRGLVVRNWLFGWYLVEFEQNGSDRAAYGAKLIKTLAARLKRLGIKGTSISSLKQIRSFYLLYRQIGRTASGLSEDGGEKGQTLSGLLSETRNPLSPKVMAQPLSALFAGSPIQQTLSGELLDRFPLAWSHYVTLLTIGDAEERSFYEIEANQNGWSVRELERQIVSSLYQRLALSRDKDEIRRLAAEGQVIEKATDLIKSPFVLEFLGLEEKPTYSEDDLESAIIDKLESFLLELGKGFLFEARQRRFTFDNDHYCVDLVFYNRLLRCYVLVDLKLDKLTHADLGQMQMYVNYFDRHEKLSDESPTIGIVLCARKNDALVELTLPSNANIFASKYELYLPSKELLQRQLERIREEVEELRAEDAE